MVRKLLKFFAYFLFFILMLALFVSKSNIYYLLEEKVAPYGVVISNEHLNEHLFSLELSDLHLSFQELPTAVVEDTDMKLLGLYNCVRFQDITLASFAAVYVPLKIKLIEASYTPLNPFILKGEASGEFGSAKAEFNLKSRELQLYITPSELMLQKYKNSLVGLKKLETGEYLYAKTL